MGKTSIHMSYSPYYRRIIRAMHIMRAFDRTLISLLYKIPYGSVSRVFSELENENYIQKLHVGDLPGQRIFGKSKYSSKQIKLNDDLKKCKLNYGSHNEPTSIMYEKTPLWESHWLERWNDFLAGGEQ
jgi:hypothetical protein